MRAIDESTTTDLLIYAISTSQFLNLNSNSIFLRNQAQVLNLKILH